MCIYNGESVGGVRDLRDDQLIERLKRVLARERCLTAELLCHLSEVELRGVYLRHAYSSMHAYCVAELHMSASEAYLPKDASAYRDATAAGPLQGAVRGRSATARQTQDGTTAHAASDSRWRDRQGR
jgi:hypothetical protein